jgi:hypothetical protein
MCLWLYLCLDGCSRVMDVTAALYSHGTLLLAESSGADAKATKLLLAARNYTLPPPSVNVNTASQSIWLREVVSDLSQLVPGEAGPTFDCMCAVAAKHGCNACVLCLCCQRQKAVCVYLSRCLMRYPGCRNLQGNCVVLSGAFLTPRLSAFVYLVLVTGSPSHPPTRTPMPRPFLSLIPSLTHSLTHSLAHSCPAR